MEIENVIYNDLIIERNPEAIKTSEFVNMKPPTISEILNDKKLLEKAH